MNPSEFAATIDHSLRDLQSYAAARFEDTFTAYSPEWDKDADDLDVQVWVEQYDTPGRVAGRSRDGDTNTRTATVGGVERPVVEGGLHIPIGAELPAVGWVYICTAVGPSSDPALLNRWWRVVDVPAKSQSTARRLDVVEVPQEA